MAFEISKSTRVLLAFASVYLFWGSTYAGIRIAGEQLSAPVVSGARCVISAVLIAGIALAAGKSLRVPKGEAWKLALIGLLFMSGNNMALTWAEQMVPSGFASLVVSSMPIMIALLETVLPDGEVLDWRGWAGTLMGMVGIGLLVSPSFHAGAGHAGAGHVEAGLRQADAMPHARPVLGVCVLLFAAASFAGGSVLSRRFRFKADTFVATGWQLGAAGIFNMVFATFVGGFRTGTWTVRGVSAIVYLAVFGSLFGLVAFTYLLKNVPVTKVAPYAFVNPMIAVLLGAMLFGERLVGLEYVGMTVIVCGVATVVLSRVGGVRRKAVAAEVGEPA